MTNKTRTAEPLHRYLAPHPPLGTDRNDDGSCVACSLIVAAVTPVIRTETIWRAWSTALAAQDAWARAGSYERSRGARSVADAIAAMNPGPEVAASAAPTPDPAA